MSLCVLAFSTASAAIVPGTALLRVEKRFIFHIFPEKNKKAPQWGATKSTTTHRAKRSVAWKLRYMFLMNQYSIRIRQGYQQKISTAMEWSFAVFLIAALCKQSAYWRKFTQKPKLNYFYYFNNQNFRRKTSWLTEKFVFVTRIFGWLSFPPFSFGTGGSRCLWLHHRPRWYGW